MQDLENHAPGGREQGQDEPAAGPQAPAGAPAETRFRVTRTSQAYRYVFLVLLTLLGAGMLYLFFPTFRSAQDLLVLILLGVWAAALLRYWLYLLDMPYQVLCREDGFLEFRSVLRKRIVLGASIRSVKVSPVYPTYVRFHAGKKRIAMINHVDGMSDLVTRIRRANPELETRGC